MNMSGILVVTTTEKIKSVSQALNAMQGIEVFQTDQAAGRLIVVQEAETIRDEVNSLKNLKKIPGIIMAEMVTHYFGDAVDDLSMEDMPDDLEKLTGLPTAVDAYLNDTPQ